MRTVFANRASGILYRFIRQNKGRYLLPANVCPIVPLTFKLAGVEFDFVDINSGTLCVDEQTCLVKARKGQCSGLVFVHTYGTQYDPQLFFSQLRSCGHDFHIIDDKCLCAPDFTTPQTVADLTLYSTGYAKYVDFGKGGFGFLQDDSRLSIEFLPFEGNEIEPIYKKALARNEKMARVPFGWLDAFVIEQLDDEYRRSVEQETRRMREHKKEINTVYMEHLGSIVTLGDDFNQWRYNIMVENKEHVLKELFKAGLFASSHYQPSSGLFVDELFPNAQRLYEHVINLFNDRYFTRENAKEVARWCNNVSCCWHPE